MLIEPQTGAVTKEVYLGRNNMIYVTGTIGATLFGIQVYDGTTWVPMILSTVTQQLSATNTYWVCPAEGNYRINKPATVAAAGVKLLGNR